MSDCDLYCINTCFGKEKALVLFSVQYESMSRITSVISLFILSFYKLNMFITHTSTHYGTSLSARSLHGAVVQWGARPQCHHII